MIREPERSERPGGRSSEIRDRPPVPKAGRERSEGDGTGGAERDRTVDLRNAILVGVEESKDPTSAPPP